MTAGDKNFVMLFADFAGLRMSDRDTGLRNLRFGGTYRNEGGAPGGMKTWLEVEGLRRKRRHMIMITRAGKSRTRESGSETLEFPVNRIRLRKKSEGMVGVLRVPFWDQFEGKEGEEGVRFSFSCAKPIDAGGSSTRVAAVERLRVCDCRQYCATVVESWRRDGGRRDLG